MRPVRKERTARLTAIQRDLAPGWPPRKTLFAEV